MPQNLRLAMKWFSPKTIVIDDCPLTDVIFEYEDITIAELSRLKDYLKGTSELLFQLIQKIQPDLFQDIGKEIRRFIKKNRKELEREYKSLNWEDVRQHRVKTKIIYLMLKAQKLWVFGLIDERGTPLIRICGKMFTKRNFRTTRIEYITATPQNYEKSLLKQLSSLPIREYPMETPIRKNTTVIQIDDALYPTTTIKSKYNTKFKRINKTIDEFISKPVRSLNLGVVVFLTDSCKKIILSCYKNLKPKSKNCSTAVTNSSKSYEELIPILLHGKGSLGTNDLINITIGIVSGISFQPPSFFVRPPYIRDFKKLRRIIGEKISSDSGLLEEYENIKRVYKNEGSDSHRFNSHKFHKVLYESIGQYGVDTREIVKNRIKQAIARIARGKDVPKLIIIISNINLTEDGFIPEVGVYVKRVESNKLVQELKAWFEPFVEKAVEKERMRLNEVTRKRAEELAEAYGCFSWSWYYKRLKHKVLDKSKHRKLDFNRLWNTYVELYFELYPDAPYPECFEDEDVLLIHYNILRRQLKRRKANSSLKRLRL